MSKTTAIFQNRCPYQHSDQGTQHRALFVCTAGMLRSPTAASVAIELGYNARSCGSSMTYALIPLTINLISWAETIYFVNEENYYEALHLFDPMSEAYADILDKAVVWDIPDTYNYRDEYLCNRVRELLS